MISSPDCTLQTAIAHVMEYWNVESHENSNEVIMYETLPFQYFNHMSDCSVKFAIGTRNCERFSLAS